jgi:hypothetical protein
VLFYVLGFKLYSFDYLVLHFIIRKNYEISWKIEEFLVTTFKENGSVI